MYSSKKDKFNTELLKVELAKAKELGQAIKVDELTAFDRANIEFVNQYKDAVEVAAFRNQMRRICELAGINYELEKQSWWVKHHQLIDKRDVKVASQFRKNLCRLKWKYFYICSPQKRYHSSVGRATD